MAERRRGGPVAGRMTKEERRAQLLDTAGQLLLKEGWDALTMEAIAQSAGASKTLGYAYFANLDDLIWSLYDRELGLLFGRVEAGLANADTFEDRIRAAVAAYFDTVAENGAMLVRLQAGIVARRLNRDRPQRTVNFLEALAAIIREEFGLSRRRAIAYAIVMAGIADSHGRAWAAETLGRAELEESCVRFMLAGVRDAVAAQT
ncbi:MAG: TetR/AcrR family transcriptional regulator [Actinobacteria bacterium]|nr:TetR/AcrR family transcriptional regulator [Actinomycetota bacterium]MBV9934360.1 TetR/AcrR family transcriptional regulator [Actinomycetota bacterium]